MSYGTAAIDIVQREIVELDGRIRELRGQRVRLETILAALRCLPGDPLVDDGRIVTPAPEQLEPPPRPDGRTVAATRRRQAKPSDAVLRDALLAALTEHGPHGTGALAVICNTHKSTAKAQLRRMAAAGEVHTVGNRRAQRWHLGGSR